MRKTLNSNTKTKTVPVRSFSPYISSYMASTKNPTSQGLYLFILRKMGHNANNIPLSTYITNTSKYPCIRSVKAAFRKSLKNTIRPTARPTTSRGTILKNRIKPQS